MTPLVSILIPAYNAEKWIAETLRSTLNQTWPKKEIIVVDDGSRDATLEVSKRFECKHVKIITQDNTGATSARNKALSLAQGDYIQWLDADDILGPEKIRRQIEAGTEESGKLLSASFGTFLARVEKAIFNPNSLWTDLTPREWLLRKFRDNAWMTIESWLMSRKLTELAGPWNQELSLDDDGEYICRVVSASEGIKFIPSARSYYRVGYIDSLSKAKSQKAVRSLLRSLDLCFDYLLAIENSEESRLACIKYLQSWFSYFYPVDESLNARFQELARSLCGELVYPDVPWKYRPIKSFFGFDGVESVRKQVARAKLFAGRNLEKLSVLLQTDREKKGVKKD